MSSIPTMIGQPAPLFDLEAVSAKSEETVPACSQRYAGRWLVLLFYPRDFSFVCPTEMTAFSARISEFEKRGCHVLGISVDPITLHREWLETPPADGGVGPLQYPLASDPDGQLAQQFGIWVADKQVSARGLFIIDPAGILQYSVVHNLSVGRSTDEVLRVLDAIQTGGLCPASWTSADGTLDASSALHPGRIIGQYRITRPLGSGAFGSVFQAEDVQLRRPVALKVLKHLVDSSRETLLAEARTAAALTHPHICTVYAIAEEEGLPLIVMEYLNGPSLDQSIASGLNRDLALQLARQIADGLAAAHAEGVVHGDLKPANVIVRDHNDAQILDFGLARRLSEPENHSPDFSQTGLTGGGSSAETVALPDSEAVASEKASPSRGTIAGTPAYMSPEQASGEFVSLSSDVYSFGLLLVEMLTGHSLLGDSSPVQAIMKLRSSDLSDVARPLMAEQDQEMVGRLLARSPGNRPTMSEVSEMLTTHR